MSMWIPVGKRVEDATKLQPSRACLNMAPFLFSPFFIMRIPKRAQSGVEVTEKGNFVTSSRGKCNRCAAVTSSSQNSASREAFSRTSSALLRLAVARAATHAESCAGKGLDKVISLFAAAILALMLQEE